MYVQRQALVSDCAKLTGVDPQSVDAILAELADTQEVIVEETPGGSDPFAVYPASLYTAEAGVAQRLELRLSFTVGPVSIPPSELMEQVVRKLAVVPSPEQATAMEAAYQQPVLIITAQHDRVVPAEHAETLAAAFRPGQVRWLTVDGAGHNDLSAHTAYWRGMAEFVGAADAATGR